MELYSEIKMESPYKNSPKRKNLTVGEKREIIKEYDKLPKMSEECAAETLKISRMILRRTLSNRDKIIAAPNSDKKRIRMGKDKQVEEALVKWFKTVRDDNTRITQDMLRIKSEQLAKMLGRENFNASRGWLYRLCKRAKINCKSMEEGPSKENQKLVFGSREDLEATEECLTEIHPADIQEDNWSAEDFRGDEHELENTDETHCDEHELEDGFKVEIEKEESTDPISTLHDSKVQETDLKKESEKTRQSEEGFLRYLGEKMRMVPQGKRLEAEIALLSALRGFIPE